MTSPVLGRYVITATPPPLGTVRDRTWGGDVLRLLTTRLPVAFETTPPPALLPFEPSSSADPYADLADTVGPLLDAGDLVVAVLGERTAEPLHQQLLAVRSALETTRLIVHRTSLPPLATALLVRALAELADGDVVPPGILASGVERIERLIVPAAWLGSVTKLQHPSPSLKQHARSYLPRASFAAVLDDDPRVVRHRGTDAVIPLPPLTPTHDWRVAVGTGLGNVGAVEHTLATLLGGAEILRVPVRRSTPAWWGTEDVVELACIPRSTERLRDAVLRQCQPVECSWCTELVASEVCPLCGAASAASPVPGVPA